MLLAQYSSVVCFSQCSLVLEHYEINNVTAENPNAPLYEPAKSALTHQSPCRLPKVIREDFTIEAYDILELHCELVAERMRLVASQKDVPPDMDQAISTLIWAADRAEVRCLVLPLFLFSCHN